jgi:pimeloyl-ACP methyl ester carboxylesterase
VTGIDALYEWSLDLPTGRVAGLRGGSPGATPVLALHGWLDNAASFVPLAAQLRGVDLVCPDFPGHGRSAHLPPGADYSFAAAVHSVLDIADALGWDRFTLLGHSMGAGIGSLVAAACPERIARFVAIEALGALAELPEHTVRRLRDAVVATRALRRKQLRVFPDIASAVRARMKANALSEPVARLLVERGLAAVDGGFAWSSDPRLTLPTMIRTTEEQVRDLVSGITSPTLIVYAEPAQPYLPDPLRRARAALLPNGALRVLQGGHHLHMEDPAAVAAAIGEFLSGAASPVGI